MKRKLVSVNLLDDVQKEKYKLASPMTPYDLPLGSYEHFFENVKKIVYDLSSGDILFKEGRYNSIQVDDYNLILENSELCIISDIDDDILIENKNKVKSIE